MSKGPDLVCRFFFWFFLCQCAHCPPKLDELTSACVHTPCVQLLCSKHSVFCLWEVRWKDNLPSCLQCVFSADFSPLNQDVSTFKPFHYQFQLERVTVSPPPLSVLSRCTANILPQQFDLNCDDAKSKVSDCENRFTLNSISNFFLLLCGTARHYTASEPRSCPLLAKSTVALAPSVAWRCA